MDTKEKIFFVIMGIVFVSPLVPLGAMVLGYREPWTMLGFAPMALVMMLAGPFKAWFLGGD